MNTQQQKPKRRRREVGEEERREVEAGPSRPAQMPIVDVESMTEDQVNNFRLSTDSKRRLEEMRQKGLELVAAKKAAIKEEFIVWLDKKTGKRPSSDCETSHRVKPKKMKHGKTDRKYQKETKVAVVEASYPEAGYQMDLERMALAKDAIMANYEEIPVDGPQVRFSKCTFDLGFLLVHCGDAGSAEWLKETVPLLRPWEGGALKTLEAEEIPRISAVSLFVEDENGRRLGPEKILTRLKVSNRSLDTGRWVPWSDTPTQGGVTWEFLIDNESYGELEKLSMEPYFGMGRVKIRRLSPYSEGPAPESHLTPSLLPARLKVEKEPVEKKEKSIFSERPTSEKGRLPHGDQPKEEWPPQRDTPSRYSQYEYTGSKPKFLPCSECLKRAALPPMRHRRVKRIKTEFKSESHKPGNVAVVDAGFPKVLIQRDNLILTKRCIMAAYERIPIDGPQVRFNKCAFNMGYLSVNCADIVSAKWLIETVPQLKPWENAELRTLVGTEVPKPCAYTLFVPDEDGTRLSLERVLARLNVSNRCVNTSQWTCWDFTPTENGVHWLFSIDKGSFDELKKINMQPYFGMGRLKLLHRPQFDDGKSIILCEQESDATEVINVESGTEEAAIEGEETRGEPLEEIDEKKNEGADTEEKALGGAHIAGAGDTSTRDSSFNTGSSSSDRLETTNTPLYFGRAKNRNREGRATLQYGERTVTEEPPSSKPEDEEKRADRTMSEGGATDENVTADSLLEEKTGDGKTEDGKAVEEVGALVVDTLDDPLKGEMGQGDNKGTPDYTIDQTTGSNPTDDEEGDSC